MVWIQREIKLQPRSQGIYLIDDEIRDALPELSKMEVGLLHLFVKHTSAGITVNENYDPDVRTDMGNALARIAPESDKFYLHNDEGPDDMPSHIRTALVGCEVTLPIGKGHLKTGTWQGVYLCEFRRYRHARSIVATIQGEYRG